MASGYRPTYTVAPGRPIRFGKPIGGIAPAGHALPGKMVWIDTSRALAQVSEMKRQAAVAHRVILAANERLAYEAQVAESEELKRQVKAHGRPQRHAGYHSKRGGGGGLADVLRDERNRHVTAAGFTVNDERFLDTAAMYWRQLEHGYQGRRTVFRGMFADPLGRGAGGRFAQAGSMGQLSMATPGARSAYKLVQFRSGKGPVIDAIVGPRDPYRYIETTRKRMHHKWFGTRYAANVYREAFLRAGLDKMAKFTSRGATGFSSLAGHE